MEVLLLCSLVPVIAITGMRDLPREIRILGAVLASLLLIGVLIH